MTQRTYFTKKQKAQALEAYRPLHEGVLALVGWQLSDEGIDKLADKNIDQNGVINPVAPYTDMLTDIMASAQAQGFDVKHLIQMAALKFAGENHMTDEDQRKEFRSLYQDIL